MPQCKEKGKAKNGGKGSRSGRGKIVARVFVLQYEEAAPVDTFVGNMIISSCDAYVLVDTGATHACISKDFLSVCGLVSESVKDSIMFVNTPLGSGEKLTRIWRAVDVVIDDVHMLIDILFLPILTLMWFWV